MKKIRNKSYFKCLFLETVPNGQVSLWNWAFCIYLPLGNSLCQQIKGPKRSCHKDIWSTLFKPVFPQIISPWNPFSHVTFTNILRNQGFSEHTVGNADLTCSLFSLSCRNSSELKHADQLIEQSKTFLLGFMMPIPFCLWHSRRHQMKPNVLWSSSGISCGGGGRCGLLPLGTLRAKVDSLAHLGEECPTPLLNLTGRRATAGTHGFWQSLLHCGIERVSFTH